MTRVVLLRGLVEAYKGLRRGGLAGEVPSWASSSVGPSGRVEPFGPLAMENRDGWLGPANLERWLWI